MSNNNHREILFRGFHPCDDGDTTIHVEGEAVKGRWIYGAYCCMGDKQQAVPHIISYSKDDEFGDWIEVLPSTVCPYTGLTDKNGGKIFEGDIVKWGNVPGYHEDPVRIAEVKINPDIQFDTHIGGERVVFHYGAFAYAGLTDKALEVIGNIHDNPELREEEPT